MSLSLSLWSLHHCLGVGTGVDASVTGVAVSGVSGIAAGPAATCRPRGTKYNRQCGWSWLETIDRRGGAASAALSASSTTRTKSSTSTTTATAPTSATMDGLKSSLASALAAGCSKTLLAPFDTLKTIQQHSRAASGTSLTFWQAVQLVMERPNGIREFYVSTRCYSVCVWVCMCRPWYRISHFLLKPIHGHGRRRALALLSSVVCRRSVFTLGCIPIVSVSWCRILTHTLDHTRSTNCHHDCYSVSR